MTGSQIAKARYFDPKLGRFLTQDSYLGQIDEPPSLHRYTYAHNRPTFYVDPDGNEVRIAGEQDDVDRFRQEILEEWAGSKEEFERTFSVEEGKVVIREEDTPEPLDPGARQIQQLVESEEVYLFYYGRDPQEAVSHVRTSP
jgi:RHS repeat-associated protein